MDKIKLVLPTKEHKTEAEQYKKDFFDAGEFVINGSALFDQMEYDEWLVYTENNRNPQTVKSDWVPADTFFAVHENSGRIVGMIDIRHNLDNDFLASYGGHIGYSVRPGERQKGYATEMLRQALVYAGKLGLSKVMLGCRSDNLASRRTIEACGGTLTEVKPYRDGDRMNVYWITLRVPGSLSQ